MLRGSFTLAATLVACATLLAGCPARVGRQRDVRGRRARRELRDLRVRDDARLVSDREVGVLRRPDHPARGLPGDGHPAMLEASGCTRVGDVAAWLGTSDAPNDDDGAVFTPNAGETAQFTGVDTKGFYVTNGSCADYSARFWIYRKTKRRRLHRRISPRSRRRIRRSLLRLTLGAVLWIGQPTVSLATRLEPPSRRAAVLVHAGRDARAVSLVARLAGAFLAAVLAARPPALAGRQALGARGSARLHRAPPSAVSARLLRTVAAAGRVVLRRRRSCSGGARTRSSARARPGPLSPPCEACAALRRPRPRSEAWDPARAG